MVHTMYENAFNVFIYLKYVGDAPLCVQCPRRRRHGHGGCAGALASRGLLIVVGGSGGAALSEQRARSIRGGRY